MFLIQFIGGFFLPRLSSPLYSYFQSFFFIFFTKLICEIPALSSLSGTNDLPDWGGAAIDT
jgi:hypothetical protein